MNKYEKDINKLKQEQRLIIAISVVALIVIIFMKDISAENYYLNLISFTVLSASLVYYLQMKMFRHKCTVCGERFFKSSQNVSFLKTDGLKCYSCGEK